MEKKNSNNKKKNTSTKNTSTKKSTKVVTSKKNAQQAKVEKVTSKKIDNKNKPRKKSKRLLIILMSILVFFVSCITLFMLYIVIFSPDFNEENLYSSASSVLYDKDGNEFQKLGREKRELVTYDDLPEVLIDAIVATEDSRFFQHNGLDVPRFTKAVIGQLLRKKGAGGGSTITMQVSKNSFTNREDEGIKGLIRKFTDIYLSLFKIERNYTKEQILEFYVNDPFLGANSYGVEEVAQNYFGKSIRDVSLAEAAVIAGLFQAPGAYNPYVNPDATNKRKNTVLNLMYRHGYITEEEKNIAQSIDVRNLVIEKKSNVNKYQSFIDTVIKEVIKKTGEDPNKVSMKIYTTMDRSAQEVVYGVQSGDTTSFRDDKIDLGVAITSVQDGSIVAIGSGRRSTTAELTQNNATDIIRHPGSTAKPYMVYGPGIEFNNWSTAETFFDEEWTYSNGQKLKNADGKYNGIMTLKKALASSRNIPAIQGFQQLENQNVVKFASSMGIKLQLSDNGEVFESAAIGAFDGVNPLMQSAAYGCFARGGYYIEPYSITKIEYINTDEVKTFKPVRTKVMKEETAYMINMVLKYAVDNGYIVSTNVSGTDVAGKTGTSTFDASFRKKVGLPNSSIMDSWVILYSPDYVYAQWYGYREMTKEMVEQKQYLTSGIAAKTRRIYARQIVNNVFKKGSTWTKPNGVVKADIELETIPVELASDYTPKELRSTEYFIKGTEPSDVSTRFSQLENVTNLRYDINTFTGNITLNWDPANVKAANNSSLEAYFKENYRTFANKYYERRLEYNTNYMGNILYHIYIKNSDGSLRSLGTTTSTNYSYTALYPQGLTFVVKTEYTIFKSNTSTGASITIKEQTSDTPSTIDKVSIILRGKDTIEETKKDGYYEDVMPPINVIDDGINVTEEANIIYNIFKLDNDKKVRIDGTKIPLKDEATYLIEYTVKYKEKVSTLTRKIIVK